MDRRSTVFLLAGLAGALQGCVAAAITPLATAFNVAGHTFGAFKVFKTVQNATGGTTSIAFEDEALTAAQRSELERVSHVAIWPGRAAEIELAQALENSGQYEVTTPLETTQAVRELGIEVDDLGYLTHGEAVEIYGSVAERTGAEAVVLIARSDFEQDANTYSLDRASIGYPGAILVYVRGRNELLRLPYEMAIELGGDEPPTDGEVERFLGHACAEKLMELTGWVAATTAENAS